MLNEPGIFKIDASKISIPKKVHTMGHTFNSCGMGVVKSF